MNDEIRIIELYKKGGNNTTSKIAQKLNLEHNLVYRTIDKYLKEKTENYGK